jgi:hypothetical protein
LVYLRGQLEFREEENVAAGAAAGLLGAHQRFQVKCANMPEKLTFDEIPFKAVDDIPFQCDLCQAGILC